MLFEKGLEEVPEQGDEAQTSGNKAFGCYYTLRKHQVEQSLPGLEQLLVVGFGLLNVGKWLQITVKRPGMFSAEENGSGCSLGSCFVQFNLLGKIPEFLSSLLARGFHIGLLKP